MNMNNDAIPRRIVFLWQHLCSANEGYFAISDNPTSEREKVLLYFFLLQDVVNRTEESTPKKGSKGCFRVSKCDQRNQMKIKL